MAFVERRNVLIGLICLGTLALTAGLIRATRQPSPVDGLKGQRNTTLTFFGLAVDQNGNPLEGARIEYRIEAYPKDWTFETRGRLNDFSFITFISGPDGRFQQEVSGCTMRRIDAKLSGYRHFAETELTGNTEHAQTEWYCLIAQGDLWYKSDPKHPAVYVFVKEGVKEVSALPCHGGYSSGGGLVWHPNEPGWPKKPSLKDVVQKPPTTVPSTSPSTRRGDVP